MRCEKMSKTWRTAKNECRVSAPASTTSMSIGSLKQERYRQRLSNYDERLKNSAPDSTAPERPEPSKF